MDDCRKAFEEWLSGADFEDRGTFEDNLREAFEAGRRSRTPEPWVAQVREALESVANGSQLALDAPLWRLSESVCDKIRIALAAMPKE